MKSKIHTGTVMSPEQESNEGDSLLLLSKDKADGFFTVTDNDHNITLLKWGRPLAWFSAMVTEEVLQAFLEMVNYSESSDKRRTQAYAK